MRLDGKHILEPIFQNEKSREIRMCTLQHRSMLVLHEATCREAVVKLGGTTLE